MHNTYINDKKKTKNMHLHMQDYCDSAPDS